METFEVINWWLFVYGFTYDVFYLLWLTSIEKNRMWRASFWGTILGAIPLFAAVDVVRDPVQSIPYLSGMFCGSMYGMYLKKRNSK